MPKTLNLVAQTASDSTKTSPLGLSPGVVVEQLRHRQAGQLRMALDDRTEPRKARLRDDLLGEALIGDALQQHLQRLANVALQGFKLLLREPQAVAELQGPPFGSQSSCFRPSLQHSSS